MKYSTFIRRRNQKAPMYGFASTKLPDFLFDFQHHLVDWSLQKGRGAIFADCGLGKTPMQLVWADQVIRKTNKPALIITPLAVSSQTKEEADKFDIEAEVSREGTVHNHITITNFERLHYFNRNDFGAVVCDESSAIKNFDSKRKKVITEFMRRMPYRLLCTATAAPNDFIELGTSSEALGYMGYRDMLTRFFKEDDVKDHFGWGRKAYRFRGHAEHPFWRWVCSWSRSLRKPSDMGYDDSRFVLPPLNINNLIVTNSQKPRQGFLHVPATSLKEQRQERRDSIPDRCEEVARSLNSKKPTVIWCHLNDEADMLERIIPDAKQVKGSMKDEAKEETLLAFSHGDLRVLITKPKIGCWGLNWQHCSEIRMFPSHSFEQYYQGIRRCWRFGQKKPVNVKIVTTKGESHVLRNLKRKAHQADRMFSNLVESMNDELSLSSVEKFPNKETVPTWLS